MKLLHVLDDYKSFLLSHFLRFDCQASIYGPNRQVFRLTTFIQPHALMQISLFYLQMREIRSMAKRNGISRKERALFIIVQWIFDRNAMILTKSIKNA